MNRNLIRQALFSFLNFALFSDSLLIVLIAENMCAWTWHTSLTSVHQNWNICILTHSVPGNEGLVPHSCDHAACRTKALFNKLYCLCLGKHSQTETGFKTNFLPVKGENSIFTYCVVFTFKSAEILWLFKEILVFRNIGYRLFMDDDSKHKVNDLDDVWVHDSE